MPRKKVTIAFLVCLPNKTRNNRDRCVCLLLNHSSESWAAQVLTSYFFSWLLRPFWAKCAFKMEMKAVLAAGWGVGMLWLQAHCVANLFALLREWKYYRTWLFARVSLECLSFEAVAAQEKQETEQWVGAVQLRPGTRRPCLSPSKSHTHCDRDTTPAYTHSLQKSWAASNCVKYFGWLKYAVTPGF